MEHLALLRNSFILIIISLMSCHAHPVREQRYSVFMNRDTMALASRNGILYVHDHLLTANLFSFYPGTADTAEISCYREGKEDGCWKKFYQNNKLKEKRYFVNSYKTGEYMGWWENGNKKLDYLFKDDEYQGTCREWNTDGMLVKEMNYNKGHEEGPQKAFYDNGKVRSNYVIRDGRRFGLLGTKNCINASDSIFKN